MRNTLGPTTSAVSRLRCRDRSASRVRSRGRTRRVAAWWIMRLSREYRWTPLLIPLMTALAGAFLLYMSSDGASLLLLLGVAGTALAVVGTTVVLIVMTVRRGKSDAGPSVIGWTAFALQFAVIGLIAVALTLNWGFLLRFSLSRQALRAEAASVARGASVGKLPRRIGLYDVREIDRADGAVRFIIGEALLDDSGIAYSPNGEPPAVGEDSYAPLSDGWWYWTRSW
jgi:hypothetical protein